MGHPARRSAEITAVSCGNQPLEGARAEGIEAAQAANLRYVEHTIEPGWSRRRCGRGWVILDPRGKRVRDTDALARIRALAIPPAWKGVWICPDERGHLQATGYDVRGRKQYLYHPRWRAVRDAAKYDRLAEFAELLPRIRSGVRRDLETRGISRERVLAAVVRLLDRAYLRIGNEVYAVENHSYGLTTLCARHVRTVGDAIDVAFRGKSGQFRRVHVDDARLAKVVARLQDLPGQRLFQYEENGELRKIESSDVNEYLRSLTNAAVTSKDFRTWAATLTVSTALQIDEPAGSTTGRKRAVTRAMKQAASILGNTPAVCRRSYVHPVVVERYLDGDLAAEMARHRAAARKKRQRFMHLEETTLGRFLRSCA